MARARRQNPADAIGDRRSGVGGGKSFGGRAPSATSALAISDAGGARTAQRALPNAASPAPSTPLLRGASQERRARYVLS